MCIDDCPNASRRDMLAAAALALAGAARPAQAQTNSLGAPVVFPNGGVEVHAMLFRARGRRRRPLVLTAHGNPGFDADYQAFCERLAGANYTVLAVTGAPGDRPIPWTTPPGRNGAATPSVAMHSGAWARAT